MNNEQLVTNRGQYCWVNCPGCNRVHLLIVVTGGWEWNGSKTSPTFSPSLLVTGYSHKDNKNICHSFIKDGNIQFLGDCTHSLAGKTVSLLPVPQWLIEEEKEPVP